MLDKPLAFGDEKVIALSDVGVPYMDPDLSDDYNTIIARRQSIRSKIRGVSVFPSSSKLPRYLGIDPMEIEDETLRDKLNGYVQNMGFEALNDPRILSMLDIDRNAPSKNQVLELEQNMEYILNSI